MPARVTLFFNLQKKGIIPLLLDVSDKNTLFALPSSKPSTFTGLSRLIIEKIARYLGRMYICMQCTHLTWYTCQSALYTNIDLSIEASGDHFFFQTLVMTLFDFIASMTLRLYTGYRLYTKWNRRYQTSLMKRRFQRLRSFFCPPVIYISMLYLFYQYSIFRDTFCIWKRGEIITRAEIFVWSYQMRRMYRVFARLEMKRLVRSGLV